MKSEVRRQEINKVKFLLDETNLSDIERNALQKYLDSIQDKKINVILNKKKKKKMKRGKF